MDKRTFNITFTVIEDSCWHMEDGGGVVFLDGQPPRSRVFVLNSIDFFIKGQNFLLPQGGVSSSRTQLTSTTNNGNKARLSHQRTGYFVWVLNSGK